MNIDGQTKVLGVIGDPIEHTKSPLIHNQLIKLLGLNLVYLPFHIREADLASAINGAEAMGVKGLNVTIPHKQAIMPLLKKIDPVASKVSAVNTLKLVDGGYEGYNTDVYGVYRAMKAHNIEIEGSKVVIIGAGGAARAAFVMAMEYGAESVVVANRTISKAEDLIKDMAITYDGKSMKAMSLDELAKMPTNIDICIQTTPVGMHPYEDYAVIESKEFFTKCQVIFDMIYNPSKTKFMKLAEENGAKAVNGKDMLFYQGVKAFEIWHGKTIQENTLNKLYEEVRELF